MDPQHRWTQRRLPSFDYADPTHAFFITICAKTGTAPFADDRVATVVVDSLLWLRQHRGVHIYVYCLMPDHLHLLLRLSPRGIPLGDLIGAVKRFTTRQSWEFGYKGALWESRFYDHIVRRRDEAEKIGAYILANPARKGLVEDDADWAWSGCPDPL